MLGKEQLTFAQVMTMKNVLPKYSGQMKFPTTIIFPAAISSALGLPNVNRMVIATKIMPIPLALFDWLRHDNRFSGWFAEKT